VLALTRQIVEEGHLTCMMITHNMQSALELGNRTLMMDSGRIILDIAGQKRQGLTVDDLLQQFKAGVGKALDNDRMLLS
jgi:putative ABC transport system ATP-binding protein